MGLSGWFGSVTIIGIRVISTAAKKMSSVPANPSWVTVGTTLRAAGTSGVSVTQAAP